MIAAILNAKKIQGIPVDIAGIQDSYVLSYNLITQTLHFVSQSATISGGLENDVVTIDSEGRPKDSGLSIDTGTGVDALSVLAMDTNGDSSISGSWTLGGHLQSNTVSGFLIRHGASGASIQLGAGLTDENVYLFPKTGNKVIVSEGFQLNDAVNVTLGTSSGTKFGTSTSQKLSFFNSTPIVKPSGNALTALSNLGLITSPTLAESDITGLTADLANKANASDITTLQTAINSKITEEDYYDFTSAGVITSLVTANNIRIKELGQLRFLDEDGTTVLQYIQANSTAINFGANAGVRTDGSFYGNGASLTSVNAATLGGTAAAGFATAVHTHAESDITNLTTDLATLTSGISVVSKQLNVFNTLTFGGF